MTVYVDEKEWASDETILREAARWLRTLAAQANRATPQEWKIDSFLVPDAIAAWVLVMQPAVAEPLAEWLELVAGQGMLLAASFSSAMAFARGHELQ